MKDPSSRKKANKWLVFATMPFQMGTVIYLFYRVGLFIDDRYQLEGEWWSKGFAIVGVLVSLYQFVRQVNHINSEK